MCHREDSTYGSATFFSQVNPTGMGPGPFSANYQLNFTTPNANDGFDTNFYTFDSAGNVSYQTSSSTGPGGSSNGSFGSFSNDFGVPLGVDSSGGAAADTEISAPGGSIIGYAGGATHSVC